LFLRQFQAVAQCGAAPWRPKAADGDAFEPTLPNSSSLRIDVYQKIAVGDALGPVDIHLNARRRATALIMAAKL
jgi:hypothetical protein